MKKVFFFFEMEIKKVYMSIKNLFNLFQILKYFFIYFNSWNAYWNLKNLMTYTTILSYFKDSNRLFAYMILLARIWGGCNLHVSVNKIFKIKKMWKK